MQDNMIIPNNIKVGFQNRSDTYTGKLGFVVYTDTKGKLKKEKSWEGWRDKKIDAQDFKNEPISGFVLNRDVGGKRHSYGWDARIEKVRVYDPRGFEFEIGWPNLLFVLQECSAIKGKGLEGDFVYAWSGQELILLPVTAQEYKKSAEFTGLQVEKVDKKEFEVGCSYLTKDRKEVIYMGKHVWWGQQKGGKWGNEQKWVGQKRHLFLKTKDSANASDGESYMVESGFTKIAKKTSSSPVIQYAELFDALMKSSLVSKPTKLVVKEGAPIVLHQYGYYRHNFVAEVGGQMFIGNVHQYSPDWPQNNNYRIWDRGEQEKAEAEYKAACQKYHEDKVTYKDYVNISCRQRLIFRDGILTIDNVSPSLVPVPPFEKKCLTREEAQVFCKQLWVECENGFQYLVTEQGDGKYP